MSKAQVTAFVLIGILIFASFAFMLHVRNIYLTSKLKKEAKRTVRTFIDNQNIDYYITTCLDRITKEAIQLSTLQGGVLWDYQNGSAMFNNTAIGSEWLSFNETMYYNKTFNISYGLLDDASRICINSINPITSPIIQYPEPWPFKDTRLSDIATTYWRVCKNNSVTDYFKKRFPSIFSQELKKVSGALGINVLTRLCDYFGVNRYDRNFTVIGICNAWNGLHQRFVFPANSGISYNSMYSINLSLQRGMEYYVSKKLSDCVNLSFLAKLYPYNITEVSKPNITITLTDTKVIPRASYEFNVKLPRGNPVSVIQNFETPIKTRLKHVYTLASALVTLEAQDPLHRVDKTPLLNYITDINISVVNSKCKNPKCKHDKIFRIIDYKSTIFGKPLMILIGVKNRRPVLDYIGDGKTAGVDLTFLETDTIILNPLGVDPDDFPVFYNYSWWLEDYEERFNKSCCRGFGGSVDCSNLSQIRKCIIVDRSVQPHNFTKSILFLTTKQNASYKIEHKDSGLHFLKIRTWDESNLDDWQNISILIIDLPQPALNFSNLYNNTDDRYASIEDPFLLNASKTTGSAMGGSVQYYTFNDLTEGWSRVTNNAKPYIWVPKAWESAVGNINKLSKLIENISKEHFNSTGEHDLRIRVTTNNGLSNNRDYKLNVTSCIPFQSPIPAYPYSNLFYPNINPFFANHTCCIGNLTDGSTWELADKAKDCFNKKEYGVIISSLYLNFKERTNLHYDRYNIQIPDYLANIDVGALPTVSISESNDVYSMMFNRKCSGNRGNICSGDMSVEYKHVSSCYYNISLDEQCIGPSPRAIENPEGTTEDDKKCFNYTGTSFEKLLADNGLLINNNIQGSCLHGAFCEGDVLKKDFGCDNGVCTPSHIENCNNNDGCYQANNKVSECNNPPCYYRDYYCNQGSSSCSFNGILDPDIFVDYCSSCGLAWLNLGGNHNCCGDDLNEYTTQCQEQSGLGLCNNNDYGCCQSQNDCVYNHVCYSPGIHSFNGVSYYCSNNVWQSP